MEDKIPRVGRFKQGGFRKKQDLGNTYDAVAPSGG